MSLIAVIATNALAENASDLSSGAQPYGDRAWLLRNVILPCYTSWTHVFSQIIVVGEFESGPGYDYVPWPSVYKNCADALIKRDAGFEVINQTCSWVLFQHDDHLYDPNNVIAAFEAADVLSPSRWTRGRSTTPERLADGFVSDVSFVHPFIPVDKTYVNGHACLMRPSVMEKFHWSEADPVFTWDMSATKILRERNIPIRYAPEIKVWDMERGATPWR